MSGKTKRPKGYDMEFRKRAVQLALSSPQPIAQTAKDLGIEGPCLYRWVSVHKKAFLAENPNQGVGVYEELARLRKENARLKEEREILKKAALG